MFQPTIKMLESCGFAPCSYPRAAFPNNKDIYYNKMIFLNTSIKHRDVDYRDGDFYLDGQKIIFTSEDDLRNLGKTCYFQSEDELSRIKKDYPEMEWNDLDKCYYSQLLKFKQSINFH